MRKVLCFGDSNTYGYSPVDGQRYGDDINWPGVLGRLLGDTTLFRSPLMILTKKDVME